MACADRQLHDGEIRLLEAFAVERGASEGTRLHLQSIPSGVDDAPDFDSAIVSVPVDERADTLDIFVRMALADRALAPV